MKTKKASSRDITLRICTTAIFMAMNIVLSMSIFSIPVPGGHLYLCDVIISLAAIILDPVSAFCVGGIGSFLGDMIFYPLPMFVSLVTHGLQAVVISLFSHYVLKKKPVLASGIGVAIGAVIMVIGYTLGKAFIYGTPEAAIVKLPYEIAQGVLGAVLGMVLCWAVGVKKLFEKVMYNKRIVKPDDEKPVEDENDINI